MPMWRVVEDAPGRPLPFVVEHEPTGQVFTVKKNRNKASLVPRRWGVKSVAQAFVDDLNRKSANAFHHAAAGERPWRAAVNTQSS